MRRWAGTALRPRWLAALLGAGSASMLLAAAYFEHGLGLAPCVMCLWQRTPHRLVVLLAVISLVLGRSSKDTLYFRSTLWLMAALLLGGAGLAFWHAGVELGWLAGPAVCGGPVASGVDPAEALDKLLAAPVVRCDEVVWSFLGLSMAAWNGVISLTMSGLACYSLIRYREPKRK